VVVDNALAKARSVARDAGERALVLGVDTEVVLDGRTMGKPADAGQARSHLQRLSGAEHEVLSGVALVAGAAERTGLERTRVLFADLTPELMERYLVSGEWKDRAGGYAVQGFGSALVRRVDGDLSNVIGLPILLVSRMIEDLQDGLQTIQK